MFSAAISPENRNALKWWITLVVNKLILVRKCFTLTAFSNLEIFSKCLEFGRNLQIPIFIYTNISLFRFLKDFYFYHYYTEFRSKNSRVIMVTWNEFWILPQIGEHPRWCVEITKLSLTYISLICVVPKLIKLIIKKYW